MKEITVLDKTFVPYLQESEILDSIGNCARKLNEKYKDSGVVPVLVCVLNGAILFTAELMKRLEFDFELASIKVKSYEGTQSTGCVTVTSPLSCPVRGREVVICEDIVDTGTTIVALKDLLIGKEGAKSVSVCTMLLKPEIYKQDVPVDIVGIEIPNRFILGYGLDYDELGRGLKDIYVLKK